MPLSPVLIIVAGPPGSGKSIRFRVQDFGVDAFNVDDRCRELHGSYQGIPPEIRRQAEKDCERFIEDHLRSRRSFATETTLRTGVAIEQAKRAKQSGFLTTLLYVGTGDAETNIERIRLRGLAGGHAARPEVIRDTYARSLRNLAPALLTFDRGDVFDNGGTDPRLILEVRGGHVKTVRPPVPSWVRETLQRTALADELDRPRESPPGHRLP